MTPYILKEMDKSSILILIKSNGEIFGGFASLLSDRNNKSSTKAILFNLNSFKVFSKL